MYDIKHGADAAKNANGDAYKANGSSTSTGTSSSSRWRCCCRARRRPSTLRAPRMSPPRWRHEDLCRCAVGPLGGGAHGGVRRLRQHAATRPRDGFGRGWRAGTGLRGGRVGRWDPRTGTGTVEAVKGQYTDAEGKCHVEALLFEEFGAMSAPSAGVEELLMRMAEVADRKLTWWQTGSTTRRRGRRANGCRLRCSDCRCSSGWRSRTRHSAPLVRRHAAARDRGGGKRDGGL